jgi:hypothetical protein
MQEEDIIFANTTFNTPDRNTQPTLQQLSALESIINQQVQRKSSKLENFVEPVALAEKVAEKRAYVVS